MGPSLRNLYRWIVLVNAAAIAHGFAGNDDARAIAVDPAENVYVTGSSEGDATRRDFFTIKYNASGAVLWSARFDGTASGEDIPNAIVVDQFGNVFVTGSSLGLGSGLDYLTVKYNANGVLQWAMRFNGAGNREDIPYAVDVDLSGNVYVTGSSQSTTGDRDFVTLKYNANGALVWTRTWTGYGGEDISRALKVDASANVYVAGSSTAKGSGLDYILIKYDADGTLLWWREYNGPGNGDDVPSALALDSKGKVYVTGRSLGASTGSDYATLKFNANGRLKWIARFDGPGHSTDEPTALAVDAAFNVYVTGASFGANGSVLDYGTVKYDKFAVTQWIGRYNGPASANDSATALALDSDANVYVTGMSLGLGTANDYATVKYSTNGALQWVARYNGPIDSTDNAAAIAVHAMTKNVYVTGSSLGSGTGSDFATIKYDTNSNVIWVNRFDGP